MALHHCHSGEVARPGSLDDPATATAALARMPSFEAIHLVVRAGDSIASHRVAGSLTLYCIAGHTRLGGDASAELRTGDWLFLEPGTPHTVEAVADTSLLLTILFDESAAGRHGFFETTGGGQVGEYRKLWWTLIAVLTVTFAILGISGVEVYRKAPPIPAQVVTASGEVLMTKGDIMAGQAAWQSTGGMQLGSVWGHGAYQAPDWSADWLHRELIAWLSLAAQESYGKPFDTLAVEQKAALTYRLKQEYRHNSLDAETGVVTVSDRRARAIALALFGVYGFLALGFTLLVLRYIRPEIAFNERLMRVGFWGLNAGLVLMIFTSLLPVGLFQFEASATTGMWYARSDTFLQQGFLETLRWVRTFGDVVFIVGAVAVAWQVVILGLWRKGARA